MGRSIRVMHDFLPDFGFENNGMVESFDKSFKLDYVQLVYMPDSVAVISGLKAWLEYYN
jgi:hypothetical protein